MKQEDFIALLETYMGQDLAATRAAGERVQAMKAENPVGLIIACSNVFQDNRIGNQQRTFAGLLLKSLMQDLCEKEKSQWNSLDKQIREEVKDKVLMALAWPNNFVRTQAAYIIGLIYVNELSLEEPDMFLPIFTQGSLNTDPEVRKSAIMALENFSRQFKINKIKPAENVVNQLITAIFSGLKDNDRADINSIAVVALTNSLSFAEEIFRKTPVPQEILATLAELVAKEVDELTEEIMEFLSHFMEMYFDLVRECTSEVWKLTLSCINSGISVNSANLAVSIWKNIALQENKNPEQAVMIPKVEKFLVPLLMKNLTNEKNFENEEADKEAEIIRNSKECLALIAQRPNTILREEAFNSIKHLYSENPLEIGAIMFIYSCILDQSPEAQDFINQNIARILELINHSNVRIQQGATQLLAKIAEISPQTLSKEPLLSQ